MVVELLLSSNSKLDEPVRKILRPSVGTYVSSTWRRRLRGVKPTLPTDSLAV